MQLIRGNNTVHKTVKQMAMAGKNRLMNKNNTSKQDLDESKLSKTQQIFSKARKISQIGKRLANQNNNSSSIASEHQEQLQQQQEDEGYLVKQSKTLKEMIETGNSDQRALSLIDDTLELLNNQELKVKGRDRERYELINKEEFEKLKRDNEEFKKQRKLLSEEYSRIKEAYEKESFELSTMNYTYFSVEKQKTDSITKIYQMENEVKSVLINNCKLNNEIAKEQIEKDNIFRAMNEFIKKYENAKLPKELADIFKKIKNEKYNPMFNIDHKEKISILEEKINKMKLELHEKDKLIEELKIKTQKNG